MSEITRHLGYNDINLLKNNKEDKRQEKIIQKEEIQNEIDDNQKELH